MDPLKLVCFFICFDWTLGSVYDQGGRPAVASFENQIDEDTMIVENDHLVTKSYSLPEVQESVDMVSIPQMAVNPYQIYNPYYRPYVARMPVYSHPFSMPSYYGFHGITPDDIRFMHYMNTNPFVYNRPFMTFV